MHIHLIIMFEEVYIVGFADFQEFGSLPSGQWLYQKVAVVNKSSNTVWFSGRRPKQGVVGVVLCQREELSTGPCIILFTTRSNDIRLRVMHLQPGVHGGNYSGPPQKPPRTINTVRTKIGLGDFHFQR